MSDLVAAAQAPNFIDEILKLEPERGRVFAVRLGNFVFTFRAYSDHGEYSAFKRKAIEFAKKRAKPKNCPAEWQPFHIKDPETLVAIFMAVDRSVEPDANPNPPQPQPSEEGEPVEQFVFIPKLSHLDCLKIAHGAPLRFESLIQTVGKLLMPDFEEDQEIEDTKVASGPTPDSETA